jgi:type II secretory pathway pseudopilin PulG
MSDFRPCYGPAFTLIELLVVVTIIVVLLALLTPALDNAIYQGELAVCASNMHSIAAGGTIYATGYRRYYPDRKSLGHTANLIQAHPTVDDRPLFRQFLHINEAFNDPASPEIDLETHASQKYADQHIYFGWKFANGSQMKKLGDRFSWTEGSTRYRFRWLVSDQEQIPGGSYTTASHPDDLGGLVAEGHQDEERGAGAGVPGGVLVGAGAVGTFTFAYWIGGNSVRGAIDMNYVADDLSAVRHNSVIVYDERMVRVPLFYGTADQVSIGQLPQ